MTHRTYGLTRVAAVLCLSVTINGQQPPTAAPGQAAGAPPEAKPTTITGCLVQGLPGPTGSAPAAGTKAGGDYFVRTPTVKVPVGSTVAVGSPGTTSAATSSGTPAGHSFYRIAGLGAEQLRPHVGHRVEMQGRVTDNMPGLEKQHATTTQDKGGRATTTAESRVEVAGVLHATAITMVSATCEP